MCTIGRVWLNLVVFQFRCCLCCCCCCCCYELCVWSSEREKRRIRSGCSTNRYLCILGLFPSKYNAYHPTIRLKSPTSTNEESIFVWILRWDYDVCEQCTQICSKMAPTAHINIHTHTRTHFRTNDCALHTHTGSEIPPLVFTQYAPCRFISVPWQCHNQIHTSIINFIFGM